MPTDTERLDFLEGKGAPGMSWVVRESTTGRGYRLHQSPHPIDWEQQGADGVGATPREAIDAARRGKGE